MMFIFKLPISYETISKDSFQIIVVFQNIYTDSTIRLQFRRTSQFKNFLKFLLKSKTDQSDNHDDSIFNIKGKNQGFEENLNLRYFMKLEPGHFFKQIHTKLQDVIQSQSCQCNYSLSYIVYSCNIQLD